MPITCIARLISVYLNSVTMSQNVELSLDVIWYKREVFDDKPSTVLILFALRGYVKSFKFVRPWLGC